MTRLTRAEREEIVSTFYGINPTTCEVENVAVTRGGKLLHADLSAHVVAPGQQARTEIRLVYGLLDLFEVYPQFAHTEHVKEKIEALKTKAARIRAGETSDEEVADCVVESTEDVEVTEAPEAPPAIAA